MRNRVRLIVLAGFATLAAPGAALSQTSVVNAMDAYLDAAAASGDLHGSVLVADANGVVLERSAGYASYEWSVPNAADTRFRIGSITKQFTALLVLQEIERGNLALDDTITEHLPYYRADTGAQVTISQLLNHASGIPDLVPEFESFERYPYTRQDFVERFCSGDLEFAPGDGFAYSNAGYYILGAILEQATGRSYGDLLREHIFAPLGMDGAVYVEDATIIERAASGYRRPAEGADAYTAAAYIDPSVPFAMGGIHATAADLYKWDRALYANTLLSAEYTDLMFTPLEGGTYSNGWMVYEIAAGGDAPPIPVMMHQGSINGFSGVIYRDLARRNLVVVLNNVGSNGAEFGVAETLMKILAADS